MNHSRFILTHISVPIGKGIPHTRPLEPPTTQHNWAEGRWTGLRTTTVLYTCRAHPHNSFIFLYLFLFCVVFIRFLFLSLFLLIRSICRDLYTTCACMLIVRSYVPLRQPEDGQYRSKHAVVHYIVIKYTSCDTVMFDYIQFSKPDMSYPIAESSFVTSYNW